MWKLVTCLIVFELLVNHLRGQENTSASNSQVSAVQLVPFLGHNKPISSIALSGDGRYALTGDKENLIILWELENRYSLRSFTGHKGPITGLVFSKDNNYFYSSSADETIRKWDIKTGHQVSAIESFRPIYSLSIDNNEEKALCGRESGKKTFSLLELNKPQKEIELTQEEENLKKTAGSAISSVDNVNKNKALFTNDGSQIISTSNLLNLEVYSTLSMKYEGILNLHKAEIIDFKSVKNGPYILSSYKNGIIALWNTVSFDTVRTFKGNNSPVTSLAVSSDGKIFIAATGNKELIIWNISNGRIIKRIKTEVVLINLVLDISDKYLFGSAGMLLVSYNIETGLLNKVLYRGAISDFSITNTTAYPNVTRFSPRNKYIISGSTSSEILVWDIGYGILKKRIINGSGGIYNILFRNDDNEIITNSSDSLISFRNIEKDVPDLIIRSIEGIPKSIDYNDENKILTFCTDEQIKIVGVDLINKKTDLKAKQDDYWLSYSLNSIFNTNNTIICGTSQYGFTNWNLKTGRFKYKKIENNEYIRGIDITSDGKYLITGSKSGRIDCWNTGNFSNLNSRILFPEISTVKIAPDDKTLFIAGMYQICRVSIPDFNIIKVYSGLDGYVNYLDISNDNNKIIGSCADGKIHVWDTNTGKKLITVIAMNNYGWFAYTPEGYFDTDVLEYLGEVKWIFRDEPMKGYPMELFMRDFYQPNLLRKVFNNEMVSPTVNIENKNRNIPVVSLSLQNSLVGDDTIIVNVKSEYLKTKNTPSDNDGFYDLRIFRDGQLVGQYPSESEVFENSKNENQDIEFWRKTTEVKVNAGKQSIEKSFRIKIAYKKEKDTEISAYLFNRDRIKSETAKIEVKQPEHLQQKKGIIYLVNIGVGNSMNFHYRLPYAADDAILLADKLDSILKKNNNYDKIVPVRLVSEVVKRRDPASRIIIIPTKDNIQNTFSLLSGRISRNRNISYFENKNMIKTAGPNDLVIITYHGHGIMDNNQMFYIVPYDANYEQVINKNYSSLISSSEIAELTKHIDAGKIILIIDACYSASAIENEWFKPGPFGNKGLGQIAYDKGILVLVATQKDQTANELGNGILTYTFLKEELLNKRTDMNGKYSIAELLKSVETNTPIVLKKKGINAIQEPKLYNFQKENSRYYEPVYISWN
jgi:WD40 repeat protein